MTIRIKDNGIGILINKVDKIFDRFYQIRHVRVKWVVLDWTSHFERDCGSAQWSYLGKQVKAVDNTDSKKSETKPLTTPMTAKMDTTITPFQIIHSKNDHPEGTIATVSNVNKLTKPLKIKKLSPWNTFVVIIT